MEGWGHRWNHTGGWVKGDSEIKHFRQEKYNRRSRGDSGKQKDQRGFWETGSL